MSDTPRTDELAQGWDEGLAMPSQMLTLARELERENAALNRKLDDILTNKDYEGGVQFWVNKHDAVLLREASLLAENAELREAIEVEKERGSYWNDFAENATVLNAQLRADKDRLDWLLDNISPDSVLWNVNPTEDSMSEGAPDPWRAAIDTARKRAQS